MSVAFTLMGTEDGGKTASYRRAPTTNRPDVWWSTNRRNVREMTSSKFVH